MISFVHTDQQTPSKMNNLLIIFVSVIFAAVRCGANPHAPLEIVNGTDTKDGEFPYVVQLYGDDVFICGGAIIGETWVLTSALCTLNHPTDILYGKNALFEEPPADTLVKIKRIVAHPKFTINREAIPIYDVAVLELDKPIQFGDKAEPLKLAESDEVPFHVPGILTGWGLNGTNGRVSRNLKKIELELLNDSECFLEIKRLTNSDQFNSVHHICSDYKQGGQCNGDSGNPLVINGLGYGVVSWSFKPCATSPGAYSRITNPEYRNFIKEVAGI